MAAGTVATAAGAVMLLYYLLSRGRRNGGGDRAARSRAVVVVGKPRRVVRRPAQAPATWLETLTTLSETLRFTYSETLGKWPIADLAFGINYLLRKQGNLNVASVYAGEGCVELQGPEIADLCHHLVRLLTLCYFFSKKPFPVFLELVGYSQEDVLIQKPKAGILKPAFTIIHDKNLKQFILLIRGTHSIKDTLTAATGAVVPFHHSVVDKGGVSNLVLGYAHCGMVAAARWIAKVITPCLIKALSDYPDHGLEVVGHSLGGGTAALLTYILREQKEFSSSTCITFGSAACMTWDLAESGKPFITSIINGSDLVPTVSAASVDGLRSEVTASSWLNDLRDQVEHTRVLNVVYRSATALGSHLPSVASAKARVAGAGALLRPVSSRTQVVIKRAQDVAQAVRTRSSLSSWSCIGPRRRAVSQQLGSNVEKSAEVSLASESSEALLVVEHAQDIGQTEVEHNSSSGSGQSDTEEDEFLVSSNGAITSSNIEEVTEGELWYELEKQLQRQENEVHIQVQEEEAAAAKEIIEEEKELVISAETSGITSSPEISESQRFYPPGQILHIVSKSSENGDMDDEGPQEEHVAFYETPRDLYSRIRLSKTMIHDHYMPVHKKMIELIIKQLEHADDCSVVC